MSILSMLDPIYFKSLLEYLKNLDTQLSTRASDSTLQTLEKDIMTIRYSTTIPSQYALIIHAPSEIRLYTEVMTYGEIIAVGDLVVH